VKETESILILSIHRIFIEFLEACKPLGINFDVMLESKMKDLSLFKLVEDIKELRKDWKWIDNTTLEI